MSPALLPSTPTAILEAPHAPESEPVACALCGQEEEEELYPKLAPGRNLSPVFAASLGVRGATRIVRCRRCDLCYVSPRLTAAFIHTAYRVAFDHLYVAQAEARRRSFRRNLRVVMGYRRSGRLLDVGCAAGYFLDVARAAGWDAVGIEPNAPFVAMARERHADAIIEGTLLGARGPRAHPMLREESFDVITMWDVLEHTTDPKGEVRRARQLLKPGGLLFVNFPNIASLPARLTGRSWWFLLSHHLYYFTPATLGRLLEGEGLGVIARRACLQTLELGYLAGMMRLYSEGVARALRAALERAGLSRLPISYYAGQMTLVAAR